MLRRSLRIKNASGNDSDEVQKISTGANLPSRGSSSTDRPFNRSTRRQHHTGSQSTGGSHHATGERIINSSLSQSNFTSNASDASMTSSVFDESLTREQTEVGHLWRKAGYVLFWWLGTGWYQLSTRITLLNLFLLNRLRFGALFALLPTLTGSSLFASHMGKFPIPAVTPESDVLSAHGKKDMDLLFDGNRIGEIEKQIAAIAAAQSRQMQEYGKMMLMILKIQEQVVQLSDSSQMSAVVKSVLNQHFSGLKMDQTQQTTVDSSAKEHESRLLHLETLVMQLSKALEEIQEEAQPRTSGSEIKDKDNDLLIRIQNLEAQIAEHNAVILKDQTAIRNCEHAICAFQKVHPKVRESIQMTFASKENLPKSLLQLLSTNYMSKDDFTTKLQETELRMLKKIAHHVSMTRQKPRQIVIERAVAGGVSSITEEEARVIVNKVLKLFSEDRTGMLDIALESGGGNILRSRCSETYETKTAVLSLYGFPLWYYSKSPRVVIQPAMNPGDCWAMKGSQGYLAVQLSMRFYPTAFSIEHIPKALLPARNISSAPKDFAIYGLEDKYQQEGTLLVRNMYDQNGEPVQIFQVMEENQKSFHIVELKIFSNWGHTDYTWTEPNVQDRIVQNVNIGINLSGLCFWGFGALFALLPTMTGSSLFASHMGKFSIPAVTPQSDVLSAHGKKDMDLLFDGNRIGEIEKQLAAIAAAQSRQMQEYGKMMLMILKIQEQVVQMSDSSQMSAVVKSALNQHFSGLKMDQTQKNTVDSSAKEHESRLLHLETLVMQLSKALEEIQEEAQPRTSGSEIKDKDNDLLIRIQNLEGQIAEHNAAILKEQTAIRNCEHAVCAFQKEAHVIVNKALKLFSEDRTGMVDFALESGGGSILRSRCSETYETKTAVLSLYGFPLWYYSKSPRVVIQPAMNPGDCWAMKGSQGYLAVQLSMRIYPTAFSIEHIPKALSPAGNISSAPKDFAIYGLEDKYQQEGTLLVWNMYDQNGEPVQIFQVMEENQKSFHIVELKIFSNWGHTDYTCLYRFRAHGIQV